MAKRITVEGEFELFQVPFIVQSIITLYDDDRDTRVVFTVRVGDRTLGDVLRYLVDLATQNQELRLDPPWNVLDTVNLSSLVFQVDVSAKRYGFKYSDIGLDLTFLSLDALEGWYQTETDDKQRSVDIGVYGTFFGLDFTEKPITWDALTERPPETPGAGEKTFQLDYLGLGQHVTLRDIEKLDTVGAVITELTKSYKDLPEGATDPLTELTALTYDDASTWLVGTRFSVMESFDLSAIWNLPALAGLRVGLRGERVKSLAGFEFEILYKKVAEDLGVYQIELKLPDTLRKFNAGAAAVTLPIINIDIYTDGGFLVDLGFPHNLDFSRSFSIEMIIMGIPVTGALGVYFGVLDGRAVPEIPQIVEGSIAPAIVAGVGARIGVGKSLEAGILKASIFIGIEGTLVGIVGFYQPVVPSEQKGTFYRVSGAIQLSGYIYGQVNFVIVKAEVDLRVYVGVGAVFESYRATILYLEAGVSVSLRVTVGFGFLSFKVSLSFSASIREEVGIGVDEPTPWRIAEGSDNSLSARFQKAGFRRLPTGECKLDEHFQKLLRLGPNPVGLAQRASDENKQITLTLYFHPVATVGNPAIWPSQPVTAEEEAAGEVLLVATLMGRLSRSDPDTLSPLEEFARAALEWGLAEVQGRLSLVGAPLVAGDVTLSQLDCLECELSAEKPGLPINLDTLRSFLEEYVALEFADPPADPAIRLSPVPMLPFLTLNAGDGAYVTNFETEPMCSKAYQHAVSKYFGETAVSPGDTASNATGKEELSMAGLIFIDNFRMILRSVVGSAIAAMKSFTYQAGARNLQDIIVDTDISEELGLEILGQANAANKSLFAEGSAVFLTADGVRLCQDKCATLFALANLFRLPQLQLARQISLQDVLEPGLPLIIEQGQYVLALGDTKSSIAGKFGVDWEHIEDMNPPTDWRPYAWPLKWKPNPVKDQELPVGTQIQLPPLQHVVMEGETLREIASRYAAPLSGVVAPNPDLKLKSEAMAWRPCSVLVQDNESLATLGQRLNLGEEAPAVLLDSLTYASDLLQAGARITVPEGRYTFVRGDTLASVAAAFQTTETSIKEANPGVDLAPPPSTDMGSPYGLAINLPPVTGYVLQQGDSLSKLVRKFSLPDASQLLALNWESAGVMRPLAVFNAPLLTLTADGNTAPVDYCRPLGLDPIRFVVANQGAPKGPAAASHFNQVVIPDCEKIPMAQLLETLGEQPGGDDSSAYAAAVTATARFLLSGLRLPNPGDFSNTGPTPLLDAQLPLYPMYALSGQEWPAPRENILGYPVILSWNDSEAADEFRRLTARIGSVVPEHASEVDPITATLDELDQKLIDGFAAQLAGATGLQAVLRAATPFPMVERIPLYQPLDHPLVWSTPNPPQFVPVEEESGDRVISLYPLQNALRQTLPSVSEPPLSLDVFAHEPKAREPGGAPTVINNRGWATRINARVHRVVGTDGNYLSKIYELFAQDAQGQEDLVGLLRYLQEHAVADADITVNILYGANPLGEIADTLCSDQFSDAQSLQRVVILKSNLSTDNHPVPQQLARTTDLPEMLAAANLTEARNFLELLWQATTTNNGGFYLRYGTDEGLPEALFETQELVTLSFLVVVRQLSFPATIQPRRFHNVLICAENLPSAVRTLSLSPSKHAVAVVGEGLTQSLDDICSQYPGLTLADLAACNISAPDILQVGAEIAQGENPPYFVLADDTLLTVALTLKISVGKLAELIAPLQTVLRAQALVHVYPAWSIPANTVDQSDTGIRVVRQRPPEVALGEDAPLDAAARIQWLFNLQLFQVLAGGGFRASNYGLPIVPDDLDYEKDAIVQHLWRYPRLLPLSNLVTVQADNRLPDALDPYAGLGNTATIGVQSVDVFGNILPSGETGATVNWPQLYRDRLVPIEQWPSTHLNYEVGKAGPHEPATVNLQLQFDAYGYSSATGNLLVDIIRRATEDRRAWVQVYYQVSNGRVNIHLASTLNPIHTAPVDSYRYAEFAEEAYDYLGVVEKLTPLYTQDHASNLAAVAKNYALSVEQLAQSLAKDSKVLMVGQTYLCPVLQLLMPGDSIDSILAVYNQGKLPAKQITPAQLGERNPDVPLSDDLTLKYDGQKYTTKVNDTLAVVAKKLDCEIGDLAKANAKVPSLWRPNDMLWLCALERAIDEDDTLASLARLTDLPLEHFARVNKNRVLLDPAADIAIPAHQILPDERNDYIYVAKKATSFETVSAEEDVAAQNLVGANFDTYPLLEVGISLTYQSPRGGEPVTLEVEEIDTLATITRKFREQSGDEAISAFDIVNNADNRSKKLIAAGGRLLRPPRRRLDRLSLPHTSTNSIGIMELAVTVTIERPSNLVDPYFCADSQVYTATHSVAPFSGQEQGDDEDPCASLWGFANALELAIPQLRVAKGNDVISSLEMLALVDEKPETNPTTLLVVQNDPDFLGYTLDDGCYFFAPEPLSTEMWNAEGVPIYPYDDVPLGVSAPPEPEPAPPQPIYTNFVGVDLERWAQEFFSVFDLLMNPLYSVPMQALSPQEYTRLIAAKELLAEAIAKRVTPILETTHDWAADSASAQQTLKQQLLISLGAAYRGGVVVQRNAVVRSFWSDNNAPALYGQITQAAYFLPDDSAQATLDYLVREFGGTAMMMAELLYDASSILVVGAKVPVGVSITIEPTDTIGTIVERAKVSLEDLVDAVDDRKNFLKPGAALQLVQRSLTAQEDDSFVSVLSYLANDLLSHKSYEKAVQYFVDVNGAEKGVFRAGITLRSESAKKPYITRREDSIETAAQGLDLTPNEFVLAFSVYTPLLYPGFTWKLVSSYPASSVSSTRLSLVNTPVNEDGSKFNFVYVTSAPDDTSNVKLKLRFNPQDLEYNIRDVSFREPTNGNSYYRSSWATFITDPYDEERGKSDLIRPLDLGEVQIPIVNRQFPIPPAVISQDAIPDIGNTELAAPSPEQLKGYHYEMNFTVHQAAQDELEYHTVYNELVDSPASYDNDDPGQTLAGRLAQYVAIKEPLWDELSHLRGANPDEIANTGDEKLARAVTIFSQLAGQIAEAWLSWQPPAVIRPPGRVKIRKHSVVNGPSAVTVVPAGPEEEGEWLRPLPRAELIGAVPCAEHCEPRLRSTVYAPIDPEPEALGADRFRVTVEGLNVLSEQSAWGKVTVIRNSRLVESEDTRGSFVLYIRDVAAARPVMPDIAYAGRLDVADSLGKLSDRLARFLREFLELQEHPNQHFAVTLQFARYLVDDKDAKAVDPSDPKSMFLPIATSPMITVALQGGEGVLTPEQVGKTLQDYLSDWILYRPQARLGSWSFSFKLFSKTETDPSQPPLLELADLRVRISDD